MMLLDRVAAVQPCCYLLRRSELRSEEAGWRKRYGRGLGGGGKKCSMKDQRRRLSGRLPATMAFQQETSRQDGASVCPSTPLTAAHRRRPPHIIFVCDHGRLTPSSCIVNKHTDLLLHRNIRVIMGSLSLGQTSW